MMESEHRKEKGYINIKLLNSFVGVILIVLANPFNIFSESFAPTSHLLENAIVSVDPDTLLGLEPDTVIVVDESVEGKRNAVADTGVPALNTAEMKSFTPNPKRAVWLSALFPGLGQLYNRRFWKLPLVAAGFMGLGYGTSWNNTMLRDYTRGYSDLMDSDPTTNSYMDFFPSTVKEEDLDHEWLVNVMKSRKDYYRRNRDLCIISMIGVYLLAMVDAYVDASLSQFDITPDLSMQVSPAVIPDVRSKIPGLGLQWALTF